MKPDTFTKIILTVIAINLTLLTVDRFTFVEKANAAHLLKPKFSQESQSNIVLPVNADGTVDVHIKSLPSNIKLEVNLDEIGGSHIYRTIPVEIENNSIRVETK